MARQLKRWESPRKEGRNDKGKGGSARQRQRRKQMQVLRQKLKQSSDPSRDRPADADYPPTFEPPSPKHRSNKKGEASPLPLFV
jgi:hypothetical protein